MSANHSSQMLVLNVVTPSCKTSFNVQDGSQQVTDSSNNQTEHNEKYVPLYPQLVEAGFENEQLGADGKFEEDKSKYGEINLSKSEVGVNSGNCGFSSDRDGVHSLGDSSRQHVQKSSSGFFGIFKWFQNRRKKKKKSADFTGDNYGAGDMNSLCSSASECSYIPVSRSRSAENSSAFEADLRKDYKKKQLGKRFFHDFRHSFSPPDDHKRRPSNVSETSMRFLDPTVGRKRVAPQPPLRKESIINVPIQKCHGTSNLHKCPSESHMHVRVKRKAPPPPSPQTSTCSISDMQGKFRYSSKENCPCIVSSIDNLSMLNVGRSNYKTKTTNLSSNAVISDGNTLSPRPWYKRKISKTSSKQSAINRTGNDQRNESWMPEIQFSRRAVDVFSDSHLRTVNRNNEVHENRSSQMSLLANISELDKEASEEMRLQVEKRDSEKSRENMYRSSGLVMLTQKDLLPDSPASPQVPIRPVWLIPNGDSITFDLYDNMSNSRCLMKDISKHNAIQQMKDGDFGNNQQPLSVLDSNENGSSFSDTTCNDKGKDITAAISNQTLLQRAVLDAELFYQLAKESNCDKPNRTNFASPNKTAFASPNKTAFASPTTSAKVANGILDLRKIKNEEGKTDSSQTDTEESSGHQHKIFGMRMNQCFTPDVSTIMETTESIGSSGTRADDLTYDDFSVSIASARLHSRETMVSTRLRCEFFVNSSGTQSPTAATVSQTQLRKPWLERSKTDEILDGALMSRVHSPPLITELNSEVERRKKWICCACTLINLPWRLQCEACLKQRPQDPVRVENGEVLETDLYQGNSWQNNKVHMEANVLPSVQNLHRERELAVSKRGINWEQELQKYFMNFDDHLKYFSKDESLSCKLKPNLKKQLFSDGNVENETSYGKILRVCREPCQVTADKSSQGFAISSNIDCRHSSDHANSNMMIDQSNSDKNPEMIQADEIKKSPELDQIRQARIAKFQLVEENSGRLPCVVKVIKNNRKKLFKNSADSIDSKCNSPKEVTTEYDIVPEKGKVLEMQKIFASDNNMEKTYYNSKYLKSQARCVLKPKGIVKDAVRTFNQIDSEPKTVKSKRKLMRQSFVNIQEQAHKFDQLASELIQDDNSKAVARKHLSGSLLADKEIVAAIAKFNEIAAMAEVERIEENRAQKREFWKSKVGTKSLKAAKEAVNHGFRRQEHPISSNNISEVIPMHFSQISQGGWPNTSKEDRHSLTINAETFELIHARDFHLIEAEHESGSKTHETQSVEETNGEEVLSSKEEGSFKSQKPCGITNIPNVPSSEIIFGSVFGYEKQKEKASSDENAVGENSVSDQRMTTSVATNLFKDKKNVINDTRCGVLKTSDETAPNVSRLLRQLESSITDGDHRKAARLARDLSALRVACSVSQMVEESSGAGGIGSDKLHVKGIGSKSQQHEVEAKGIEVDVKVSEKKGPLDVETVFVDDDGQIIPMNTRDSEPSKHCTSPLKNNGCGTESSVLSNSWDFHKQLEMKEDKSRPSRSAVCFPPSTDSSSVMSSIGEFEASKEKASYSALRVNEGLSSTFSVKMFIEDRKSHQGPISLEVTSTMNVGDLKRQVSRDFGFPFAVQRWILGRRLATDDDQLLGQMCDGCTIFLYLVAPDQWHSGNMALNIADDRQVVPHDHKYEPDQNISDDLIDSEFDSSDGQGEEVVYQNVNPRTGYLDCLQFEDCLSTEEVSSGWICRVCTLTNHWDRPGCEMCSASRPVSKEMLLNQSMASVLQMMDQKSLVPNPESFECSICFSKVDIGEGIILRDCLHSFCRECLVHTVEFSDTADVKCPFRNHEYSCNSVLQEREIKALVSAEVFEHHLNRSVKEAEGAMANVFHCRTVDCHGWCQYEDTVNEFKCLVCGQCNCLTCQTQHDNQTCQEYQDSLQHHLDDEAFKTKKLFDDMIRRGDGLPCPKCSVMLVRKWGCDWMRCPMCRTEICWVTGGPRWGPGGTGDTTGGCQCGVRGRKCHPKCNYCH